MTRALCMYERDAAERVWQKYREKLTSERSNGTDTSHVKQSRQRKVTAPFCFPASFTTSPLTSPYISYLFITANLHYTSLHRPRWNVHCMWDWEPGPTPLALGLFGGVIWPERTQKSTTDGDHPVVTVVATSPPKVRRKSAESTAPSGGPYSSLRGTALGCV
jgi:hypothetical protein